MVLKFLCGVRKFSEYTSEVLNTLCVEECEWYGDGVASVIHKVTFDTLHWLFEAQDNVIAKLLRSSDVQLRKQYGQLTTFDCFVLGYCVSHSNCSYLED